MNLYQTDLSNLMNGTFVGPLKYIVFQMNVHFRSSSTKSHTSMWDKYEKSEKVKTSQWTRENPTFSFEIFFDLEYDNFRPFVFAACPDYIQRIFNVFSTSGWDRIWKILFLYKVCVSLQCFPFLYNYLSILDKELIDKLQGEYTIVIHDKIIESMTQNFSYIRRPETVDLKIESSFHACLSNKHPWLFQYLRKVDFKRYVVIFTNLKKPPEYSESRSIYF